MTVRKIKKRCVNSLDEMARGSQVDRDPVEGYGCPLLSKEGISCGFWTFVTIGEMVFSLSPRFGKESDIYKKKIRLKIQGANLVLQI